MEGCNANMVQAGGQGNFSELGLTVKGKVPSITSRLMCQAAFYFPGYTGAL